MPLNDNLPEKEFIMDNRINALRAFLDASHSVYHAQAYLVNVLEKAGYGRLSEAESWELVPGGR